MKTLLALAPHPDFADSISAALNPEQYRVVHRTNVDEAEPFIAHGLADLLILDVELSGVQGTWILEKLRRRGPKCPIIVCTGARQAAWEEEAYAQGATHVLSKPVRPRTLYVLIERLFAAPSNPLALATTAHQYLLPSPMEMVRTPDTTFAVQPAPVGPAHTLGVLRDFSGILTHSLNLEVMLKQFLMLLREIVSINRAAIFLRVPSTPFEEATSARENRRLRAAASVGLSAGLLEHFELSLDG